ncbi:MAG TPA: methyltransferase domain-containing protein [Vicinamibacterales bacterium]|jgi:tRNA A58 N-methylase Trm61|nr:methyltransferase domain-containing protein [Vicinamibacterales bacterium]
MLTHSRPAALLFVTLLVPVFAWSQRAAESTIATERIFEAIALRPGITVCELGAGDGALTIAAARLVGATGRVFTSELGDERVKTLRDNVAKSGLANITVVEGAPAATNLADSACDALFLRNVYHHFPEPAAMNAAIRSAVKPGARVAVVDFTPPADEAPTPAERSTDGMHGIKAETLTRELKEAGFQEVALERGAQRWFMVVVSRSDS